MGLLMWDSSRFNPFVMFQVWLCLPGKGSQRTISGGVLTAVSTMRVGSLTWYVETSFPAIVRAMDFDM